MQAMLSEFFTWAWGEGYVDKNPLAGRDAFGEKARERVLEDKELAEIWDLGASRRRSLRLDPQAVDADRAARRRDGEPAAIGDW